MRAVSGTDERRRCFWAGVATSAAALMEKWRSNEQRQVEGRGGQPTGVCEPGFSADWQFCVRFCRALLFRTSSVGLSKPLFLKPAWLTAQM